MASYPALHPHHVGWFECAHEQDQLAWQQRCRRGQGFRACLATLMVLAPCRPWRSTRPYGRRMLECTRRNADVKPLTARAVSAIGTRRSRTGNEEAETSTSLPLRFPITPMDPCSGAPDRDHQSTMVCSSCEKCHVE